MEKGKLLILLGVLIYLIYEIIDRFVYKFPNTVAVIIMAVGLIAIFVGLFIWKK